MSRLSPQQREAYERDGTLFPLAALGEEDVARCRSAVDELVDRLGGPGIPPLGQTHLFFAPMYELAAHPAVLDIVEDVIGPDILIHSTTIFPKYPHDEKFVTWHQDGFYWNLDEPRLTSAWIALSDSAPDNGCLRVVPGSHTTRQPHHIRHDEKNMLTTGLEIEVEVDEAQARDVVLRPGEVSLHHVNLIHGSKANPSDRPRIGFAARYVSPLVHQARPHHAVLHVRGRMSGGDFRIAPPPSSDIAGGLQAFLDFRRNGASSHA